jgi:hypothetical protein
VKKNTTFIIIIAIFYCLFVALQANAQLFSTSIEGGLAGKGAHIGLDLGSFSGRLGYNRSEQDILNKNNLFKKIQRGLPIEATKNSSLWYLFGEYGIPNLKAVAGMGYKTRTVFRDMQIRTAQPLQTEGGDILPTSSGIIVIQDKLKSHFMPYLGIKIGNAIGRRLSVSADFGYFFTSKKEYTHIESANPAKDLLLLNTHENGYGMIGKIHIMVGYRLN